MSKKWKVFKEINWKTILCLGDLFEYTVENERLSIFQDFVDRLLENVTVSNQLTPRKQEGMMNRQGYGSLVFCCFLALLWLYAFLSNTPPSSKFTSDLSEQNANLDVSPNDSIEKYLDAMLE